MTAPSPPVEETPALPPREEFIALRRQLHLTQKQLGKRLGVEQNTIGRYERGILPVPPIVILFTRSLLGVPQKPIVFRVRQRLKGKTQWEVAFVLVRMLPHETRCWFRPGPDDYETRPCEGKRMHFLALLPPSPKIPERHTATVTCEAHATIALYWLKKQYGRWASRVLHPRQKSWYQRWVQTLRRYGDKDKEA